MVIDGCGDMSLDKKPSHPIGGYKRHRRSFQSGKKEKEGIEIALQIKWMNKGQKIKVK